LFVQVEYEAEYERALVEVKEELREKEVNERTIGNFAFEIIIRQFHIVLVEKCPLHACD